MNCAFSQDVVAINTAEKKCVHHWGDKQTCYGNPGYRWHT